MLLLKMLKNVSKTVRQLMEKQLITIIKKFKIDINAQKNVLIMNIISLVVKTHAKLVIIIRY